MMGRGTSMIGKVGFVIRPGKLGRQWQISRDTSILGFLFAVFSIEKLAMNVESNPKALITRILPNH